MGPCYPREVPQSRSSWVVYDGCGWTTSLNNLPLHLSDSQLTLMEFRRSLRTAAPVAVIASYKPIFEGFTLHYPTVHYINSSNVNPLNPGRRSVQNLEGPGPSEWCGCIFRLKNVKNGSNLCHDLLEYIYRSWHPHASVPTHYQKVGGPDPGTLT